LLNHPMIDGWDTDVIAEDHHMFFKCACASYWEEIHEKKQVSKITKLKVQPIWLPLSSYMAEDVAGWWPSVVAKFQQARRHAQGVSEISYLYLQWCQLKEATTDGVLAPEVNFHFWGNMAKYFTAVLLTNIQGTLMCIIMAGINLYLTYEMFLAGADVKRTLWSLLSPDDYMLRFMFAIVALYTPFVCGLLIFQSYLYVIDNLSGEYTPLYKTSHPERGKYHEIATRPIGMLEKLRWLVQVMFDYFALAFLGQIIWGSIPGIIAIVGLSRNGHKFEYIVAAKPEGQAAANRNNQNGEKAKTSAIMNVPAEKVGKTEMKNFIE